MCQEIRLSRIRDAIVDHLERDGEYQLTSDAADDLISRCLDSTVTQFPHALEHRQRAQQLLNSGDQDGAAIHQALYANMLQVGS